MNRFANVRTISLASALMFTATLAVAPQARADEWNKRTIMKIDNPILVPNKELPAGTYVIKLLSSPSDRHIVQIFNADESHIITTILAINNYRLQPTGKSQFTFWETPAGDPPALRAWFYPGDNFGQEFAYPKDMVAKLSAMNKATAPVLNESASTSTTTATPATPAEPVTPPANTVTEQPQQPPPPVTPTPAMPPAQAQVETPTPTPTPTGEADRTNEELPHTASNYPAIALAGLTALAIFGLLSFKAKKSNNA